MTSTRSLNYQSVLAQGWIAWMLLLLLMIALMSERGGFSEFAVPSGSVVLPFIGVFGTLQVLMSVAVRLLDSILFRWVNAGFAALTTRHRDPPRAHHTGRIAQRDLRPGCQGRHFPRPGGRTSWDRHPHVRVGGALGTAGR